MEFFCRKFVDVNCPKYDKETNTINVKKIDEICVKSIPQNHITNIEWHWAGFQKSSNSENKTIVPDPENYTLGRVVSLTDYGAFIEIKKVLRGLSITLK